MSALEISQAEAAGLFSAHNCRSAVRRMSAVETILVASQKRTLLGPGYRSLLRHELPLGPSSLDGWLQTQSGRLAIVVFW